MMQSNNRLSFVGSLLVTELNILLSFRSNFIYYFYRWRTPFDDDESCVIVSFVSWVLKVAEMEPPFLFVNKKRLLAGTVQSSKCTLGAAFAQEMSPTW